MLTSINHSENKQTRIGIYTIKASQWIVYINILATGINPDSSMDEKEYVTATVLGVWDS